MIRVNSCTSLVDWRLCAATVLASCLMTSHATVVQAQSSTSVYVMKTDGSEARKVASADGFQRAGHARWSRDGKRLAFHVWEGPPGARKVFVVGADATNLREIGTDGQLADWSPDDKQLAFQNREGVWVEDLEGNGRTFLGAGSSPRWSPDGTRLALTDGSGLIVRNLVEDTEENLLDGNWERIQPGFDWSPDGRQLAFVATRQGNTSLWIMDATKPAAKPRLRLEGSLMGQVSWSPDGKQLAVTLNSVIQLVHADDKSQPRLIPGQRGNSRDPAWSPDGKWIAFSSSREEDR